MVTVSDGNTRRLTRILTRQPKRGNSMSSALKIVMSSIICLSNQQKIVMADVSSDDYFGYSVAASGDYFAVAAPQYDGTDPYQGIVLVYHKSGASVTLQATLSDEDLEPYQGFGFAVAMDGDYLIAGSYSLKIVYAYHRDGENWDYHSDMSPATPEDATRFGSALALSGNYALIGAYSGNGAQYEGTGTASRVQEIG